MRSAALLMWVLELRLWVCRRRRAGCVAGGAALLRGLAGAPGLEA